MSGSSVSPAEFQKSFHFIDSAIELQLGMLFCSGQHRVGVPMVFIFPLAKGVLMTNGVISVTHWFHLPYKQTSFSLRAVYVVFHCVGVL